MKEKLQTEINQLEELWQKIRNDVGKDLKTKVENGKYMKWEVTYCPVCSTERLTKYIGEVKLHGGGKLPIYNCIVCQDSITPGKYSI